MILFSSSEYCIGSASLLDSNSGSLPGTEKTSLTVGFKEIFTDDENDSDDVTESKRKMKSQELINYNRRFIENMEMDGYIKKDNWTRSKYTVTDEGIKELNTFCSDDIFIVKDIVTDWNKNSNQSDERQSRKRKRTNEGDYYGQ